MAHGGRIWSFKSPQVHSVGSSSAHSSCRCSAQKEEALHKLTNQSLSTGQTEPVLWYLIMQGLKTDIDHTGAAFNLEVIKYGHLKK